MCESGCGVCVSVCGMYVCLHALVRVRVWQLGQAVRYLLWSLGLHRQHEGPHCDH